MRYFMFRFFWMGAFLALLVPSPALSAIWPFGSNSPHDTLMNTWGELQSGWYLHGGIDITAPAHTLVFSANTNYFRKWENGSTISGDSCYFSVETGDSAVNQNCEGWGYSHIDIAYTRITLGLGFGDTLVEGDTVSNTYDLVAHGGYLNHLHFFRLWGHVSDLDVWPPPDTFDYVYPNKNPLDVLPSKPDTFAPRFIVAYNPTRKPISFRPDSTGLGGVKQVVVAPSETLSALTKKVDVIAWVRDRTRHPSRTVAVDRILYSIRASNGNTQGWKGFSFRGGMPFDTTSLDSIFSSKVYADTDFAGYESEDYHYIPSNTDSISSYFVDGGFLYEINRITGWWNTKQHKDRAWDNSNDAESLSVARFPDGYCWVLCRATDHANNVATDSLKVIVNNFPPQVDSTYPLDGVAGVPRACTLRVWFDQPMDTVSAKAGFHLRLKNSTTDISGTKWFYSGSDTFMLFKPDSLLLADTTYLMKDSTSTKDVADSTMTSNHLVWFSTQRVDIHFSHSNNDSAWIEVRDTLFQTKRQFYAQASWPETSSVWGQMIALDRAGKRYVCEDVYSIGADRCAKYDTSGTLVTTFLDGSRCRGITTDGDTLYVTLPFSANYTNRVMRLNLNGDTLSSWASPDSTFLDDISYSTETGKLFTLAWRWKYQGGSWLVRNLTIKRYTRGGQLDTSCVVDIGGDLSYRPFRLTVGKDRVYVARSWHIRSGFPAGDTLAMYNWDLDLLGKISTRDTVTGPTHRINSLIADKEHLYVLLRSYTGTQYRYWVHVFTPAGTSLRDSPLSGWISGWESYAAIAVYPSILGVTGSEAAPGGGIGDGGPQSAEVNTLLPRVYALGQSYPNPANGGLRIDYALPKESQVSLKIYNVAGQLVRSLREGEEKPGFYKAEWDGKDQQGRRVASGVYLYRMEAGEFRKTRKLVMVR